MNSWSNGFYHTPKGKILGSVTFYNDRYKAVLDNFFIGWFISEEHAKLAIQEAYEDSMEQRKFEDLM